MAKSRIRRIHRSVVNAARGGGKVRARERERETTETEEMRERFKAGREGGVEGAREDRSTQSWGNKTLSAWKRA